MCLCFDFETAKIMPQSGGFYVAAAGYYAANVRLNPDEMSTIREISDILVVQRNDYLGRSGCSKCWLFCFNMCVPSCGRGDVRAKVEDVQTRRKVNFKKEWTGPMLNKVKVDVEREVEVAVETVESIYKRGRWSYDGFPDEDGIKKIEEVSWSMFPQQEICFDCIKPLLPSSWFECAVCMICPCHGYEFIMNAIMTLTCLATSPCWSCCSSMRYKKEWVTDKDMSRTTMLLTTDSVRIKTKGFKYVPLIPN